MKHSRRVHGWLPRVRGLHASTVLSLLLQACRRPYDGPRHVFICVADHYEPMWGNAPMSVQRDRVDRWVREYPKSIEGFTDSIGRPPQHTFFYPAEVYIPEHLEKLATLRRIGIADVEVHLHHDNDSEDGLRSTLEGFTHSLHCRHGLLEKDGNGRLTYGFIHGNWALCNSRPDGRLCGVNDEIRILLETGCYADFTLPSAPSPTQTRTVNSIYYARSSPTHPKGHDSGIVARANTSRPDNALLMISGPLALDWKRRRLGLLPGMDNADIHGTFPPTPTRVALWLHSHVHVAGRPDWLFIKLHTHGAKERNANVLLGNEMAALHTSLARFAAEDDTFRYYYTSARDLAALVAQAEHGQHSPFLPSPVVS